MLNGQKIIVVLPAYNAAQTLRQTYHEIPKDIVDEVLLVDDYSRDETVRVARELNISVYAHTTNLGYGANQKTCYRTALDHRADVIIMLHPDYQYTPKLIPAIASILCYADFDVVLGSRILCGSALKGGMPIYKYFFNRVLTLFQNIILGQKISEYHTGYRAFRRAVLESINFEKNSNDFIFDNQILIQIIDKKYRISEISCPAKYFHDASSINLMRSMKYGIGIVFYSILYLMKKLKFFRIRLFD